MTVQMSMVFGLGSQDIWFTVYIRLSIELGNIAQENNLMYPKEILLELKVLLNSEGNYF